MFSVMLAVEWHLSLPVRHPLALLNWPEFHFCSLMGVMVFFARLPVDAVSIAPMYTQPVHAAEVGIVAVIVPPRSPVGCGAVEGANVVVLVCC